MSQKNVAPIVLISYNRPQHLRRNLESLAKNDLASETEIYAYADGPKADATEEDLRLIEETRQVVRDIDWCKKLTTNFAEKNIGLSKNIIAAISAAFEKHDKVIIVEDDLYFEKGFLQFMNDALDEYENDERVMSVGGYIFPIKKKMPDTFFYRGASIYGWATWKRAWKEFNPSASDLMRQLDERNEVALFNMDGIYYYYQMLEEDAKGNVQAWDVRWQASIFVKNGLTLLPGKSLVNNTGKDGTGTHPHEVDHYTHKTLAEYMKVKRVEIEEDPRYREAFKEWYLINHEGRWALPKSWIRKGLKPIKRLLNLQP